MGGRFLKSEAIYLAVTKRRRLSLCLSPLRKGISDLFRGLNTEFPSGLGKHESDHIRTSLSSCDSSTNILDAAHFGKRDFFTFELFDLVGRTGGSHERLANQDATHSSLFKMDNILPDDKNRRKGLWRPLLRGKKTKNEQRQD